MFGSPGAAQGGAGHGAPPDSQVTMAETSSGTTDNSRGANLSSLVPRLLWRERELAVARLASTLTHTLGTPLQVIAGRAALARNSSDLEEIARHLEIIQRKCSEITALLWKVLDSLRVEQPATGARLDLAELLGAVLEDLRAVGAARGITWSLRLPEDEQRLRGLALCAEDLRHALFSVGLNLLAEAPDGSELKVELDRVEQGGTGLTPVHEAVLHFTFHRAAGAPEGDGALTSVADPWLHADGRRVDGGALGWAAVHELARGNEGRIEVSAATVTLSWPIVS